MAASRLRKSLSALKRRRKAEPAPQRAGEKRLLQLETLEDRRLMAVGPALVAVIPNSGVFLQNNVTLNVAPRDLTFRFAQGNSIDPATLASGIQVTRAGGDGAFGASGTAPDVVVTPGYLGVGDTPREVIMRFAANLPDDLYRVTLVGSGLTPLKDTTGFAFNGGIDQSLSFTLDLGAKIDAVVPQPITRGVNNVLTQNSNTVEVYFDQKQLSNDVLKPGFYHLIDASTGTIRIPDGNPTASPPILPVTFDSATMKATLYFKNGIAAGTYKLEIGTTTEPNDRITLAQHVGNSMTTPIQAFIGDNLSLTAANQGNDVDLYRFDLQNAVSNFALNVSPAASLDAVVRLFKADGTELQVINAGAAGAAESVSGISLAQGTYYVGVSSAGNATYNANTNAGATGGTSTGAYSIRATFTDSAVNAFEGGLIADATNASPIVITSAGHGLATGDKVNILGVEGNTAANSTSANPFWAITVIDQDHFSLNLSSGNGAYTAGGVWTIDNSSFDSATVLGVVGSAGKSIGSVTTAGATISSSLDLSQVYSIQFPGAGDAPGERNIPFEAHLTTVPGRLPDPTSGVETITYDFQTVYGFTPQGQKFFNAITEPQKQRAREAMELYSRYLGVQFKEVDSSVIADMTIATGDPRAIAPTISGDVLNNQGVHALTGTDSIVSNSDVSGLQRVLPITGATNASPIAITSAAHGLTTGAQVRISGVLGNTNTNGTWTVTVIDANHFTLNNSSGNGAYSGGGTWLHAVEVAVNGSPVTITSQGHGLATGDYVQVQGMQGLTAAEGAWRVTVINQNTFSLDGSVGNGIYTGGGTWARLDISHNIVIANALEDWGSSQYGGAYFQTIMAQVGHMLGLGQNYEAPALTIMGAGETPSQATNNATAEPVFPGDADIVYGQTVHRPESRDIDLYQFTVSDSAGGLFRAETIAERLPSSSLLNTVLTLYKENQTSVTGTITGATNASPIVITSAGHRLATGDTVQITGVGGNTAANGTWTITVINQDQFSLNGSVGNNDYTSGGTWKKTIQTRSIVARNDDYYGNDSYLELHLDPGTYYVAVTSVGNTGFNPAILDSGFGGRTQGDYSLTMSLKPDGGTTTMKELSGVAFDGDADGNPGGSYQFWFQSNTAVNTIYVDKTSTANQNRTQNPNLGTIGSPYNTLAGALSDPALNNLLATKKIVRIVGNGGTDGNVNTFGDDKVYLVGFKDPNRLQPLADGGQFQVPKNVTVMIDAGAAFKLLRANLNAGTTPQGLVSTSGGSIQVLGTPQTPVVFTSYHDDTVGGDSDGPSSGAQGGDYGGIVYRDDSDHERDFLNAPGSADNRLNLVMPVFLNYVNHATMTYGGGKVLVDSVEDVYDPIYMSTARPALSYNTIKQSANAGMSANPNSFDDDGLAPQIAFGNRRIGPDIHDNTIINNSVNGLFVRVRTVAGSPLDFVDVPTRWNDTDIVHVVSENLEIAGTPGGAISPGSDRTATTLTDGRLRIDAGTIVKLGGSRIETQISSQFIAEGTVAQPIVFTSLKDDKYGGSGSFDTNHDGSATLALPGDWGGLIFGAASSGSVSQARIVYGGGAVPIEGGFDSFNAIEVQQADVRIANSLLQFNDAGHSTTDRNGRGPNADGTIFVRGAQPVIVNNVIRDNAGPVASINASAMQNTVVADWGQSTGALNAVAGTDGNLGPLVRGNRMTNNRINGMVIRGGTLTTETVWDDADIVHVVFDEIVVPNHQVYSGLRLQSSPTASLVVKLSGPNAGFTASGAPLDISDRIGGTVQIIGQPGFPVVLTSISDDSISAGFDPDGLPMFDTDNSNGKFLLGGEVNNATLIDDDVLTSSVGHFEVRPGAGGSVGVNVPNSQSGVTAQGRSLLFTNQNFIFQFLNMVDVGSDGNAIDLSTSTITQVPTLVSPDVVVSEGTFPGANGPVKWHVETKFNNAVAKAFNTITFSSVDALGAPSTTALGNLRFINYLDEDVGNPTDDLLYQVGTKGSIPPPPPQGPPPPPVPPGPDFRLYTLDNAERVGFSQGAVYTPGTGLTNATFDGFAADSFNNLITAIQGTGTTYSVVGNINTTNLPTINDPALGSINGLGDVTTAMAWTVNPAATTATITTFLELIPQNPVSVGSPGDWRGVKLDQFSNDRNVAEALENESPFVGTSGQNDHNNTPQTAQFLGSLAPNLKAGDDNRRLGFQVNGTIAGDYPADVDVYSFNADSGTEAWIDIDRTSYGLDAMVELVDASGNVIARATDTTPDAPLVPNTDPGLSFAALTFDKDPYNGRDTYSTNAGTTLLTTSGAITNATDASPIIIESANHGLVTGDRVLVSGVAGNRSANGVFTVTYADPNHFYLNDASGNGTFIAGSGTWTKLVTTTRDPIMRVVLPKANGVDLKNSPWFIRVRSQPQTLEDQNTGDTVNPGLTSGTYQLQVRLQQKDEKPGSTIRFADIRYATNAIEVHGLPYHSPLAGETVEGNDSGDNTFAGAQNIGNLLKVDRNMLSVGGQLSSATDVDWYRFDLGFDLLQYVNGYTDGFKTWSTIFDIDYADGLSRPDTTLSVFDDTGRLILIGRDSNVQDDQGTSTASLASGSFGKHDAFIGPAQLPAVVPGQTRTYYVAVTSDRMLPQVLDQTFSATATASNVRLEPVESVARVADDPLETFITARHTSSGTAEFPDNTYIDPDSTFVLGQPSSTLIDTTTAQSLQANVRPFSLADVQMFVSTQDILLDVDPTVALAYASARTDFDTGSVISTGNATASTDFDTGGQVTATFTARQSGTAGNNIFLTFSQSDRGGAGPLVTVQQFPIFGGVANVISVALDTDAANIANGVSLSGTTADQAVNAIAANAQANALITAAVTGGSGAVDIANNGSPANYSPIRLQGGISNPGALDVVFAARTIGSQGNNIRLNFKRIDNNGQGPVVQVNGTTITITLDTHKPGPGGVQSGTTAQQLVNAIQASVQASSLISATVVRGSSQIDIANPPNQSPPYPSFSLQLSGGNSGFGSIEGQYAPATVLRTANNAFVNDLGYRSDGVLFAYEGVAANNNGTAGRLTQVDTAVGNATVVGNDNIPDDPQTPPTTPTQQSYQTDTLDNGDALAWGGSVLPNGVTVNNTTLYYAVQDPGTGASRLYRANPTNGSAGLANPNFGRVGVIPAGNTAFLIGNGALITAATAASGSTDFRTPPPGPASPVTISFRTLRVGTAANNGVIHFSASHLGLRQKPQVTINNTLPADLSVVLNLDTTPAQVTRTFSSSQQSSNVTFVAGQNRPGAQGNNISITFSLANRGGQGPAVQFTGPGNNTISVVLDTSFYNGTRYLPHTGTTAQQLVDVINESLQNTGIVVVSTDNPDVIVSSQQVPSVQLVGGADPSTAQDVVDAINTAIQPSGQPNPGQVVQATLASGTGSTVVALEDPASPGVGKTYADVPLNGGSGTPGNTMGLAFANDRFTLYGVTDQGQFLQNINQFNAVPANTFPVSLPDPRNPGQVLSGSNLRFAALTLGPQDVEDGRFANMFFAITDDGILTALNTNGEPQLIFDTDGDGVADSTDILTGVSQLTGTGQNGFPPFNPVTGLAFSPYDFNLWHPTYQRQNDPGHSMGDPQGNSNGLGTSRDFTLQFPAGGRGQDRQNASLYFGFEPWTIDNPGYQNSNYQTYGYQPTSLPTGNDDLLFGNGQFGMIDAPPAAPPNFIAPTSRDRQRELSLNPLNNHLSYNTPVGAYGSLITDKFSLGGMSASDKPTFYFDYFLDTEDKNINSRAGINNSMRDSARVYVGPFTRFDTTGGPFVTGSVFDSAPTATQFSAFSPVALSGKDGFYTGKALQFTSGPLNGQTRIIRDYVGATRTFIFQDGFSTAPGSSDSFQIAYGYVTWDLVATNNDFLDNPNSYGFASREGELPTFLSTSTTANPSNARQQAQLLHDNTNQWRQARVDLSRYAGQTGLQLRFDFTTAGEMPDPNGHIAPWEQEGASPFNVRGDYPPRNVVAAPGQEYLFEDGFGELGRIDLRQNNDHEGFYVDNITIGPAERGEMVINAPANTNFTDLYASGSITQPRNFDPFNPAPTQVLAGPYQLEIRRGAEYGLSDGGPLNVLNYSHNTQTPILVLDTNDRLIPDERNGAPIPVESFESQNFATLPWGFNDDAPWTISTQAHSGSFSAVSGKITNGQSSGLSIDLITGNGDLTFARSTDSEPADFLTGKRGDVLRLFIDGRLATYTAVNGVALGTPRLAQWSGSNPFEVITVPISAGHHNFRWTYDKDNTDTDAGGQLLNIGQDKVFIDDIHFPRPQVGVQNIYEDASLHDVADPNAVTPPIGPTIPPPNSFAQVHFIDTLYSGFGRVGDENADRQQGHVQIEQNQIFAASQVGILIDAAPRDPATGNPYPGGVRNLPTLNSDRLVPGVTVANNVVVSSGQAGIQYSGDPDPANQPLAAVPLGRIVNNTVYGGATPAGTGIFVTNNAGPTLLNNIVANLTTGISVDATSKATTVLGENLYANNNANTSTGLTTGTNPILLAANDPLFIDPAHLNFYLAAGSPAIDSSLDTLPDRPSIAAVKSAIGIPASSLMAPDRDLYGQLRVDDPDQSPPPGLGNNIFKDRGAVERADFLRPTASVLDPLDNDTGHRDRNIAIDDVAIRNENLTRFVIQLSDVAGIGIDDNTVTASQFVVTLEDGTLLYDQFTAAAAGRNRDYTFIYNAATDQVIFEPSAGIWPLNHTYKITINNTPSGAQDSLGNPLPAGILDRAGNQMEANRASGETSYTIFVGTLYDFGDAPDPTYPSLLANNGAAHVVQDGFHLGATVTEENEALQTPNADGDTGDDGVVFNLVSPGLQSSITVTAAIPPGMTGHLDGWIDLNRDGDWNDSGEKLVFDNNPTGLLSDGTQTLTFTFGTTNLTRGMTFARFRFSSTGSTSPTGIAPDGEVEDYKIALTGPPYQNPTNRLDVNNNGSVSPADALTIINMINAYGSMPLPPAPPLVIDPTGGGVPGRGLYVDVNGDTFLAPNDVVLVINYLNAQVSGGSGEGEGEAAALATASAGTSDAARSFPAATMIPPVLLASPDIVLEVRDRATPAAFLTNETKSTAQDLALSTWDSATSADDALSLALVTTEESPAGPLDEANWDDLLTSLASEQKGKR